MKKITCILLAFCCWVGLSGFSSISTNVLTTSGETQEIISIDFDREALILHQIDVVEFNLTIDEQRQLLANALVDGLTAKIASKNLGQEIQNHILSKVHYEIISGDLNLQVKLTYDGSDIHNIFCDIESNATQTTREKSFLTTNVITTSPLKLSKVISGAGEKYTMDFVTSYLKSNLGVLYGMSAVNDIFEVEKTYNYVASKHRLHSNAEVVTFNGQHYFHEYAITNPEEQTITTWYTIANKDVWYYGALILTIAFGATYFLVTKLKKGKDS